MAVTRVYLGFLAALPDTLIERKFGSDDSRRSARRGAADSRRDLERSVDLQTHRAAPLMAFDRALKQRGLNPGTSADLTVATLFAAALSWKALEIGG